MRPFTTTAPTPCRGVGSGALATQRSPAGSYISFALKIRSGASPPNTYTRSPIATAAIPRRPTDPGMPCRIVFVGGHGTPADAAPRVPADDVEPPRDDGRRRMMHGHRIRGGSGPRVSGDIVGLDRRDGLGGGAEAADDVDAL